VGGICLTELGREDGGRRGKGGGRVGEIRKEKGGYGRKGGRGGGGMTQFRLENST
jgi:hypothetical protein